MASHNRIILIGTVAFDPDVRVTNAGDPYVKFQLLTDRPSRDGEPSTIQDIIGVVAWRQLAENVSFKRGDLLLIEGRIQTRSYDDAEGNRKYVTEVEARDIKPFPSVNGTVVDNVQASASEGSADITANTDTFVNHSDFDFGSDNAGSPAAPDAALQPEPVLEEDIPF